MIIIKCNCGYEYGSKYNNDGDKILIGDKEFIYSDLKIPYQKEGDWPRCIEMKTIIICPKCGTLKINL